MAAIADKASVMAKNTIMTVNTIRVADRPYKGTAPEIERKDKPQFR